MTHYPRVTINPTNNRWHHNVTSVIQKGFGCFKNVREKEIIKQPGVSKDSEIIAPLKEIIETANLQSKIMQLRARMHFYLADPA